KKLVCAKHVAQSNSRSVNAFPAARPGALHQRAAARKDRRLFAFKNPEKPGTDWKTGVRARFTRLGSDPGFPPAPENLGLSPVFRGTGKIDTSPGLAHLYLKERT
ncbi:MAG: hypothetical protein V4508_00525, partial [Pseudomonadota bacterium]